MTRDRVFARAATIGLAVFCASAAGAAPGDHVWSKGWVVSGTDAPVDGQGNVSIAGVFFDDTDFGGGVLSPVGADVFVVKLTGAGNHVYSHRYTPTVFVTVDAVAASPAGDTYVAGTLPKGGTIDFGGGPIGWPNGSLWAVHFDPNGNHVWSKTFGFGLISDIDATDTHVAFSARNTSTVNFGGSPLGISGDTQAIVAKLTASGTHVWSAAYGDASFQEGRRVGIQPSGDIALLASMRGTVSFGGSSLVADADADLALAKFNTTGGHVWSRLDHGNFGVTSPECGLDITSAGEIVIAGEFSGTLTFGGPTFTSSGYDVFAARFNASGAHTWSTSFSAANNQTAHGVVFDPVGNIVFAGTMNGAVDFGGGTLPVVGSKDAFVASLDAAGAHLFSRGFGTGGNESRCRLDVDPAGAVILNLTAGLNLDLGGGPLPGTYDVAKLQGNPGLLAVPAGQTAAAARILVSPNPFTASARIRIEAAGAAGTELGASAAPEVYDAAGRLLARLGASRAAGAGESIWDGRTNEGSVAPPGVYFVRLRTSVGLVSERIVRAP